MKVALIIIVFLVFCFGSFVLGYRAGQVNRVIEEYGDQILEEIEKHFKEEKDKEDNDSDS